MRFTLRHLGATVLTLGTFTAIAFGTQSASAGTVDPASCSPSNPRAGTQLTAAQIAVYGKNAGFSQSDDVTAVAVSEAESSGWTNAVNVNGDSHCSRDRGLWQINDYWHPEVTDAEAFDPTSAAQAAYRISGQGTDWTAWSTYNGGAYQQFLNEAEQAVEAAYGPTSTPPMGALYSMSHTGPGIWHVHGWAADPDHKTTPINVRVVVNDASAVVLADDNQPDVDANLPGYGPNHGFGFDFGVPSSPAHSSVHIDAQDPVTHTWTRISGIYDFIGGMPATHFETATHNPDHTVTVKGWAIDPELVSPSYVVIELRRGSTVLASDRFYADTPRPDLGQLFPHYGPNHGYNDTFGIPTTADTVCMTALNAGAGADTPTTCKPL